jgi:outer membrane protein assembly factor BamA
VRHFDVPFSQFIKIESDFRHYYKLGPDSQIASRIIAGAGFYGNSREMPFIKQFSQELIVYALLEHVLSDREVLTVLQQIPIRFDQSGDLKLEFNTEYRAKIYGLVKGALFIDAGNIWLLNENPDKPSYIFEKISE